MFSNILVLFPLIFFACPGTTGQKFYPGPCPTHIKPLQNFNFNAYKGVWYEVEKYFFLPQIKGKCVYVRYKDLQPDGVSFQADIVQVEIGSGKIIPTPSAGRIVSTDGSAKIFLKVHVLAPFTNIPIMKFNYPYWILDTDYDDFSIKWACEEFNLITGLVNMQSVWILSRHREYPAGLREYIHAKLWEYGLQPDLLLLTDHTNCPSPPADDYMEAEQIDIFFNRNFTSLEENHAE